ncbi:glycosyltransferase family 61 protein [Azospirillum doebereinerae]|uniref:Glycosyltransferase family 61 protein n=1 Tax=Azospirillum doebereinerae TaxID=92933 RepID=A0A433J6Q9_9PROT|nr:glycosyltransferase family 61 protein [Azospirillum doebereinerae]RUQ68855.1 glycosyltransferase family 61 protein [Azospirillum doebereinerae]
MDASEQPLEASADSRKLEIEKLLVLHRFEETKARLQAARAAFPENAWFAMMTGAVLQISGADEQDRSARMGRIRAKQISDDFEKAVTACTEAIRLGSKDWATYFYLGMAQQALGRSAEAAVALIKAYNCRPDVATGCRLLETVVAARGIDWGRKLYNDFTKSYAERNLPDRAFTETWATLLFEAGLGGEIEALGVDYHCARLSSVMDWAEKAGVALDFTDECEDIPVEDPSLIGGPPVTLFKGMVRSYRPYVCTASDAVVLSKSDMVLTPDGAALNDVAADSRYGRFIEFYHDKSVRRRRGEQILIDPQQHRITDLDEGIMLSGGASEHFGHWVPEFLCRLTFLVQHPDFAKLPIIVDEDMPGSHFDYLRQLVDNELVLLPSKSGFRCRRLVMAPPPTFFPVYWAVDHDIPTHEQGPFSPRCFRFLRDRIFASLPPSGARTRRIYLSRGKRHWRHLLNDAEIAEHLRTEGFETVFPEELSFVEQVRLFQDAEAIVAPSGSSLVNLIFADPSVKLLVLNQPNIFSLNGFYGPMRALGYDPKIVCGTEGDPSDKHAHFRIPLWRLREGLAQIGL